MYRVYAKVNISMSRITELFTYGPCVKMAFVTLVQAAAAILSLGFCQSFTLALAGLQVIRFGGFAHLSNNLKFKNMINIPWSTSLSLFGIARSWDRRRSRSNEAGEGS